ncbi:hypothetical protein [Neobacillus sp. DY30]|uniref:hypothetical protein n=1 Tax=Neobacillus sp. DY30 TaxID=3047871 RepID=UPI0024BF5C22|nr:hypothetical protein [Neobacillus sp. DY30]WHY01516.1 hypothetical protein QNH29_04480 [Neobacillus sp. DY30]
MTTNILFCGYSYHTHGYHSQHKSGYPSYLFRLQSSVVTSSPLDNIHSMVKKLQLMSEETIDFRNRIFCIQNDNKVGKKYVKPNLQILEHYLQTGNRLSLINKCYHFLQAY